MTANIHQRVVPRHRAANMPKGRVSSISRVSLWQRGSVDHSTMTVGFGLIAVVVVGMLGFFYLQQVVQTAHEGTDVRTLESKILDLKEHQRQLELEGAQLRSLQAVEQNVNKLNLVTADRVTYLAPDTNTVASAR